MRGKLLFMLAGALLGAALVVALRTGRGDIRSPGGGSDADPVVRWSKTEQLLERPVPEVSFDNIGWNGRSRRSAGGPAQTLLSAGTRWSRWACTGQGR